MRVSSSIVDDLMLARQIKAAGMRWRVAYVADLVSCRMYQESREAVNGFTKNLFAAFDFHLLPFLFVFIWLAVMFWEPIIVLLVSLFGHAPQARADELIACLGLSLLLWLVPYADLRIPLGLAFLYPFTILSNEWLPSNPFTAVFSDTCHGKAGVFPDRIGSGCSVGWQGSVWEVDCFTLGYNSFTIF